MPQKPKSPKDKPTPSSTSEEDEFSKFDEILKETSLKPKEEKKVVKPEPSKRKFITEEDVKKLREKENLLKKKIIKYGQCIAYNNITIISENIKNAPVNTKFKIGVDVALDWLNTKTQSISKHQDPDYLIDPKFCATNDKIMEQVEKMRDEEDDEFITTFLDVGKCRYLRKMAGEFSLFPFEKFMNKTYTMTRNGEMIRINNEDIIKGIKDQNNIMKRLSEKYHCNEERKRI